MLSDEDRQNIRLEELYRHEVRKELDAHTGSKRFSSRSWNFLNSSFGLWFLSALFISGFGSLYAQYQTGIDERLKNIDTVAKLDLEIEHRLSQALQRLYIVQREAEQGNTESTTMMVQQRVLEVLESFRQAPESGTTSLYPEFANLSTLAVLAELRRRLPADRRKEINGIVLISPGQERPRGEVEDVLSTVSGIPVWVKDHPDDLSDPRMVAAHILKEVRLSRWSNHFYFTDCKNDPFC
ncbi:MAG: hypothetical protein MN733_24235 [Nitrososphaera sp.]|nr:hypothetical protein [Nitrososphaera sp.]